MPKVLFTDPALKRDYYLSAEPTPEQRQGIVDHLKEAERLQSGQADINAKQARESKRQFNAQIDQASQLSKSQGKDAWHEGVADTASFGISSAGAALAGSDLNAPTSARNTNPYLFAAGQTAGALVPGGAELKGAKSLGSVVLRGALGGGLMGGTSGASNAIVEGERDPSKIAQDAIPGALLGSALGAALPLGGAALIKYGPRIVKAFSREAPVAAQGAVQNAQVLGNTGGNVTINQGVQQAAGKGISADQGRKIIESRFADFSGMNEIRSALKPTGKRKYNFNKNLQENLPEIIENFKPGSGVEGFEKAVKTAQVNNWKQVETALQEGGGLNLNGNEIADSMGEAAKDAMLLRESGGKSPVIDKILERANSYRGDIPVSEAEAILQSANAKLESFYATLAKSRSEAEKILKSDPEKHATLLLAQSIRKQLDEKLSELPGQFQGFKTRYGQLGELLQQIRDAKERIANHQEMSLQEKLGFGMGLAKEVKKEGLKGVATYPMSLVANRMISEMDAPDAKINRGLEKIITKAKASKTNMSKSP